MMRRAYITAALACVFFFGHLVALVIAANTGHLDSMVRYVIVLGWLGIVLGLILIWHLGRQLLRLGRRS